MNHDTAYYKRRFNITLEPIKVMLVNKKKEIPSDEWLAFVNRTKAGVLHHPDQYLGSELPLKEEMAKIVEQIFNDFLKLEKE